MAENYFTQLNQINVNDKTEKKGNLTYLSWAWAWGEVKKLYPDATYTIYERDTENGPVNYFTDGNTAWVKTGVTVNGIEHIEYLPVMDYKNQSIKVGEITSVHVNKTIQRSLTKAIARHGLGLYIYAGEDLPDIEAEKDEEKTAATKKQKITGAKVNALKKKAEDDGVSIMKLCEYAKVSDLSELNEEQFFEVCSNWTKEVMPKCKA